MPIDVRRAGTDHVDHLSGTPVKATPESEFPQLGIAAAHSLHGPDPELAKELPKQDRPGSLRPDELYLFHPGDTVTAVGGRAVTPDQAYVLTDALKAAGGRPVPVTVRAADGHVRTVAVPAHFAHRFGDAAVDFGGLQMLPQVLDVDETSVLATTPRQRAGVLPGDVVVDVADVAPAAAGGRTRPGTTLENFVQPGGRPAVAGDADRPPRRPAGRAAGRAAGPRPRGAGVAVGNVRGRADRGRPADRVGRAPAAGAGRGPAAAGRRQGGGELVRRVRRAEAGAGRPAGADRGPGRRGQPRSYTLPPLTDAQVAAIGQNRLDTNATDVLQPATFDLQAKGLPQAAKLGIGETRDAIVQVYLTVRAMFRGGISPRELSGPVGILAVGYKFAQAGATRLLWFLSIISANLAVMNFLPIPVVDGGLFTFLIIEKLKGSPDQPEDPADRPGGRPGAAAERVPVRHLAGRGPHPAAVPLTAVGAATAGGRPFRIGYAITVRFSSGDGGV